MIESKQETRWEQLLEAGRRGHEPRLRETEQRDKHGTNRHDGTAEDEYGSFTATPDETAPMRDGHGQIDHVQASRQRHPPRYHRSRPLIPRPGGRGTN